MGDFSVMTNDGHGSVNSSKDKRAQSWCVEVKQVFKNLCFFSPLGKVAGGLYILPMFFRYFFYFFLMVDFLALVAQTLMEQSSPKFQDW